jgi:predicted molibdopterin-dependent oxidoreductase YjgC
MTNSSLGTGSLLRVDKVVQRGPPLQFTVDDQPVNAFAGESVAAALFAAGRRELRQSPRDSAPRGMFCMMGSCQECLVWVGLRQVPACQVPVTAGLAVQTLSFRRQHLD